MAEESSKSSFTSAMTLTQLGVSQIPQNYVLPPSQRPNPTTTICTSLPTIDLSNLQNPSLRTQIIDEIRIACRDFGIFQVTNHGISKSVMKDAINTAEEFFKLPTEEKMAYGSVDIHEPVRYGTSFNQLKDRVFCWRDFLKLYANPLSKWIHLWPSNPPTYREKIGTYSKAVHELQKQLMSLVFESLGLNPNYSQQEVEEGSQVLAVNFYPACPEPGLTLGIPPHSDFGSITVLLQTRPGLQFKAQPKDEAWLAISAHEPDQGELGALIVQLGDQTEVLSNGLYKSVIHRATVASEAQRLSIASLHSLAGFDSKIGPANELVDKDHPCLYSHFSFSDFLNYVSGGDTDFSTTRFIDTLKK